MGKNKSRFESNQFKKENSLSSRKEGTRQERKIDGELPLLLFNFKDFDINQCPPGQTFKDWEDNGLLSEFMVKLVDLSCKNIVKAQQEGIITIYGEFPKVSDFKVPRYVNGDVKWAVIKDIGGQKCRVAGYVIDNVFYVVFFDKNHKFWKMDK